MEQDSKRPRWVVFLLVLLPLWLVVSGCVAVWYFLQRDRDLAAAEQQRFARGVSADALEDDLRKLVRIIGERHPGSPVTAKNLTRAAAMIEGTLGPSNIGFTVIRVPGPAAWPVLHVRIAGKNPDARALWVVCAYDSPDGSPGAQAGASGVAATLAAIQALADETPAGDVCFAFLPHGNHPGPPSRETAAILARVAADPAMVLSIETMGSGDVLLLDSRDPAVMPAAVRIAELGRGGVLDAAAGGGLAGLLLDAGLPVVRVSTGPAPAMDADDDVIPAASTLAASAGRLVELIRRCAGITR